MIYIANRYTAVGAVLFFGGMLIGYNGRMEIIMNNVSLIYLLKLALRRIWILIVVAVLCAATAFCYCEFVTTPKYRAKGSVLATNGAILTQNQSSVQASKINGTDIVASLNLASTISDILNTSDIFKELADKTGGKYKYTALMGMATVARRGEDTLFIDVSFTANSREEAVTLTNTFLELAPDYISNYLPDSNTNIATTADGAAQIYPRTAMTTLAFAVLGAVAAFAVVFIIDSNDKAIKGEKDFTGSFDIPLLGVVPDFQSTAGVHYKGGKVNGNE